MLDISANVHQSTIRNFVKACDRYRDELGNSQAVAIRRGVIHLVRSLRKLTPRAKKQLPAGNIRRARPDETISYVTPKGKKKPLPRWIIVRKGGKRIYIKPTHPRENEVPVKSRAEARRRWGQNVRWGLAKKSWGWFMQALFNKSNPETGNPKATIDNRMTEGYYREVVTGSNQRVEALLVNKLNFISTILPSHMVEGAMLSATKSINAQFEKGHAKARKELT